MASSQKNIIKSNEVRMEGQFTISANQSVPRPAGGQGSLSAPVQVRIVDNQAEFAVVEVTCSCGKKTNIRCQYPPA